MPLHKAASVASEQLRHTIGAKVQKKSTFRTSIPASASASVSVSVSASDTQQDLEPDSKQDSKNNQDQDQDNQSQTQLFALAKRGLEESGVPNLALGDRTLTQDQPRNSEVLRNPALARVAASATLPRRGSVSVETQKLMGERNGSGRRGSPSHHGNIRVVARIRPPNKLEEVRCPSIIG